MDFLSACLLLLAGLFTGAYLYLIRIFSYWGRRAVPFAEPNFPYGSLEPLRDKNNHIAFITQKLYHQFKGKGPFGGAFFFAKPVVIATDLDFISSVLIKDFNYFEDRGFFFNEKDDSISAHLFALPAAKWKPLRRKLSPTFTSGKMKYMFPKVVEISNRLKGSLAVSLEQSNIIDVKDTLVRFSTDVIGCCAFGVECNSLADPNAEFRVQSRKIFDNPYDTEMGRLFNSLYPRMATFLGRRAVEDGVSKFFHSVVKQTVEHREKNNIEAVDFMHLLIQLKNYGKLSDSESIEIEKLTMDEITAQSYLFFIAGFETSSMAMLFSLYELAKNQELQSKVRAEVIRVLNKFNGELTYEALKAMDLLDRTLSGKSLSIEVNRLINFLSIQETLRKYPAISYLQRVCMEDYKIPDSNIVIEKGMDIIIPVYGIQHDPEIYPDPESYDPDRFLPENAKSRHPMTFLTFGDGPRNCIGMRFGRMQSRIGIARLLQNYEFHISANTPDKIVFQSDNVVMAPRTPVMFEIKPIK